MPVAAPISAMAVKVCPRPARAVPSGEAMNAGSAMTAAVLRCEARGCCDRLRQRHAEIDAVDEDLQHGRDDGRAAGRAEREERLAVGEHDRRRHRAARALARPGQVGVGGAALGGREVEVGQLVVEQEAAAGHDHGVAADLLDGERVLDHVAPPVGDGQVGGALAAVDAGRRRRPWRSRRTSRPGRPARPAWPARGRVDLAGPFGARSRR